MVICLVGVLVLLFSRLFYLQVLQGSKYRLLSNSNRIRTVIVHAPRGIIFDRNGVPLVFNIPGFREEVNGKTVQIEQKDALSMIAKGKKDLEVDSLREYPFKDSMAHVLGYLGQISKDELSKPQFSGYGSGDLIGKDGVEQEYEGKLRGTDGKKLIEVDAMGNPVRTLGESDPIPGQNITLTIDSKLQEAVFDSMKGVKRGAAIVSTPKGEILAMVSKPSFDPNLFTLGSNYLVASDSSYLSISDILTDSQNQPLLNRAISGVYPPGSTFKLIVAASGLGNKIIDANWAIQDTGVLNVGAFSFSNWFYTGYGRTDGEVNVVKGIQRSNDIFFYKLAEKVGVDNVSKTAQSFGLGKPLGIDLEGESSGLVPTPAWKEKTIGEQWYLGDTYHYGIGQGYLLVTPLQVNAWTQAIANHGVIYQPHLYKDEKPITLASNLLTSDSDSLIREGMTEACSPGGVAWPLFDFSVKNPKLTIDNVDVFQAASASADTRKIALACKTGTAEAGNSKDEPHSWITVIAPSNNPQIVVTILSENSGEGSNIAGPIAKQILTSWFSR
ncbi:penicillin-binding transpeptidase domain-containing protein [Patescibacteria group bacterium]|nr:penicillin-binding transpeptidase domain-containing protein [Patescibacteria group bacterium]